MPEYLSPEEVEAWAHYMEHEAPKGSEYAATLREMAGIVRAVVTAPILESGIRNQSTDALRWVSIELDKDVLLRARRLMGLEP